MVLSRQVKTLLLIWFILAGLAVLIVQAGIHITSGTKCPPQIGCYQYTTVEAFHTGYRFGASDNKTAWFNPSTDSWTPPKP